VSKDFYVAKQKSKIHLLLTS